MTLVNSVGELRNQRSQFGLISLSSILYLIQHKKFLLIPEVFNLTIYGKAAANYSDSPSMLREN